MFNDAEGFYGLEEIDDVEVVRKDNNTVQFVCMGINPYKCRESGVPGLRQVSVQSSSAQSIYVQSTNL